MKTDAPSYHGYRFPPEIISHAVWLYHRFCVSFRNVEELLAQRGITVSYEAVRLWCIKFGPEYARRLKRRQGRLGDTWHLDEVFIKIQGERQYLWRAVDQDGDVIDILVQPRRDQKAAKRFFRKLLKGQGRPPWQLVTDKLRSYSAAHREVMPSVVHDTDQYRNNLAEVSHEPTRQRERQMRKFKAPGQAQRFLTVHGLVQNLFRVGRHLLQAHHHRELRDRAFVVWQEVTLLRNEYLVAVPSDESKGSQLDAMGSLAQRQLDNTISKGPSFGTGRGQGEVSAGEDHHCDPQKRRSARSSRPWQV